MKINLTDAKRYSNKNNCHSKNPQNNKTPLIKITSFSKYFFTTNLQVEELVSQLIKCAKLVSPLLVFQILNKKEQLNLQGQVLQFEYQMIK